MYMKYAISLYSVVTTPIVERLLCLRFVLEFHYLLNTVNKTRKESIKYFNFYISIEK